MLPVLTRLHLAESPTRSHSMPAEARTLLLEQETLLPPSTLAEGLEAERAMLNVSSDEIPVHAESHTRGVVRSDGKINPSLPATDLHS